MADTLDLSKLSDEDLDHLSNGGLDKLSDKGLNHLAGKALEPGPDTTSMAGRFWQGVKDPFNGGAQLLSAATPAPVEKSINKLNNALGGNLPPGGVDEQVRTDEKKYQESRGDQAGKFDAWRTAGNIVNPLTVATGAAVPAVTGLLARLGLSGLVGGASSMTAPVTEGAPEDYWKEKGKQGALGTAFGTAAVPIGAAASRLISPNASTNPQLRMLLDEGVRPTIGQTLGGAWNAAEEKAKSIPIMGDAIAWARRRAQGQFENAAINRSQTPIGREVAGTGHDAVGAARANIDTAYDSARNQLQGLVPDQQFHQDLTQLRQMASGMPPTMSRIFNREIDDKVMSQMNNQAGGMTADTYKKTVSNLGTLSAQYGNSPNMAGKDLGKAFQQAQSLLEQTARRSNPQAAQAFEDADLAYANLVRIENAANRGINDGGRFTPGQLNLAVRQTDRSTRHNQSARGDALLQDLGNAGQSVVGNRVPDSGTAGRLAWGGLGLLSAGASPAIPAALAAGATMYTPAMQAVMRGLVSARPQVAQPIAGALTRAAPRLGAATALGGLNMLENE